MTHTVELTSVEFIRPGDATQRAKGRFVVVVDGEQTGGSTTFVIEATVYGGADDPKLIPELRSAFHEIMQALADQTKSWT